MKTTLALAFILSSCGALTRDEVPPDMQADWDALEKAEAAAKATPDPSDDAAIEEQWSELESRVAKRQASPWAALLPAGLGALGLEIVGTLGSRRKRTLYGKALKNIGTGQIAAAVGSGLQAWGAQHSRPEVAPPRS